MLLTTQQLVSIASAGGGFLVDSKYKRAEELVSIASAKKTVERK